VVADLSPVLWFPNPMNEVIAAQVDDHYMTSIWPLRSLLDGGALVAAGSDWPVAASVPNPWLSIETMITRRNPDPAFPGLLAPDQALHLPTALAAHTTNPARAMGLHQETCRIEPGLSGDFVILDRNLFDTPVERIHDTQVRQTWFAGRLVHDTESLPG
jgi:predicted amidohydrolase YtcJ